MSSPTDAVLLQRLLVGDYDELKRRLTQRLGSEDLASDVLQETYIRLQRPARIGIVSSPKRYLLTIATNIARMRFRREKRWTSLSELDAAVGFVDETPDPLQSLEGRQDMEALKRAFDALSPRRQHILVASRLEGQRLRDIAAELGLSQRYVEKELKAALMQCGLIVKREVVRRFGPQGTQASENVSDPAAACELSDDDKR
jgi:RNA polymerase sigma factor (sigma-70 family)